MKIKNFYEDIGSNSDSEIFEELFKNSNVKIERIISSGQSTPEGEWYNQDWDEFVILLKGSAGLFFENERELFWLKPGDYIFIPKHCRHRVEFTDPEEKTIWLALHLFN
jgi:cupin 2 domain-containing protein